MQPDGKFLIAGLFTECNGVSRNRIARLNADGTLDSGSNPGSGVAWTPSGNYTLNGYGVMEMCLQSDGKILITGEFNGYNGFARKNITRLNANGSLDIDFNNTTFAWSGGYQDVTLQPDGKILTNELASTTSIVLRFDHNGLDKSSYFNSTDLPFGAGTANVNFTLPTTQVHDIHARTNTSGVMVLVAGDVNFNGLVQCTGVANDRDLILARIGGIIPTNTVNGYYSEDVNKDGMVNYTGTNNDRDVILHSIGGIVPTNTVEAGLP